MYGFLKHTGRAIFLLVEYYTCTGSPVCYIILCMLYILCMYLVSLIPVRSQLRPDRAPPPAVPCPSVQSCRRSAIATGLDHKSTGIREVCIIGPTNRCLVLMSCHTRPVNCRLLCGPGFCSTPPEASSLIANHIGWTPKVGIPK